MLISGLVGMLITGIGALRRDPSPPRAGLDAPHRTGFEALVKEMVDEDCRVAGMEGAKK